MVIKIECYVSTRYVGSERDDIIEVEVPEDYDIENDPDNLIEEEFSEWLFNNIDSGWVVKE